MNAALEQLATAWKVLCYVLRGGQEDALRDLREHEELLEPLRALGADVTQRIRDAAILEACGMPSSDVPVIAKVWASGRLDVESFAQLQDHGIQVEPVVDWVRRAVDREIQIERLMAALGLEDQR